MIVKAINSKGSQSDEVELSSNVFDVEVSNGAIYHAIRNELANRRVGTAATKGRSQVRGTSRKPWRQKGTGRARAGDVKSPLWTGGGVIFGPQPRSYRYKVPRKAKRLAIRSILTSKAQSNSITVVDGIIAEKGKTKSLVKQLEPISRGVRTVWLLDAPDRLLLRAARNIPWLRLHLFDNVTAHDLYYAEHILMSLKVPAKLAELLASDTSDNIGQDSGPEEAS